MSAENLGHLSTPFADANKSLPSHLVSQATGLSYKFQRLREKLRVAISTGELSGKLPGERALARRFHVNAKTLSKALTDLAAEGVLDRSIGRGTYVKGSAPAAPSRGRWLVIADPGQADSAFISVLRSSNSELQVACELGDMRPSFLSQFSAVIDSASDTPEAFLRDLVVRNMPLVAVNREPKTYSMHSVLLDIGLGASRLGRDLMLAGHRRIATVEPRGSSLVSVALRQAMARYGSDGTVDACTVEHIGSLLDAGATAIVCGSCESADRVKTALEKIGLSTPGHVSLAAIGCASDLAPCSGYYCSARQLAEAAARLLQDAMPTRPTTLWLAGVWHDLGTIATLGMSSTTEHQRPFRIGGMAI